MIFNKKRKLLSIFTVLFAVLLIFSGCESKAEKEYKAAQRQADLAYESYERAARELEELEDMIDDYNKAVDRVKQFE